MGFLDDIKSKLSFGQNQGYDDYADQGDGYDDYYDDGSAQGGYGDTYQDGYSTPAYQQSYQPEDGNGVLGQTRRGEA